MLYVLPIQEPQESEAVDEDIPKFSGESKTLEGHTGPVSICHWNTKFNKLTSIDANGLVVVWILHKGNWYEEMINNRNKSIICDSQWTDDGRKICLVYEDGGVVGGAVEGQRLFGKEFELPLSCAQWSPDGGLLLLGTHSGEVHVFDTSNDNLENMILHNPQPSPIVAMHWYASLHTPGVEPGATIPPPPVAIAAPTLVIAYADGYVQLSRGLQDAEPVVIYTGLHILSHCQWHPCGMLLAVVGQQQPGEVMASQEGGGDDVVSQASGSVIQFYTQFGTHVHTFKPPVGVYGDGSGVITALSFHSTGFRFLFAVGRVLTFASLGWTRYTHCLFPRVTRQCFRALALTVHCQRVEVARPLSHRLFNRVMTALHLPRRRQQQQQQQGEEASDADGIEPLLVCLWEEVASYCGEHWW